MNLNAFILGSSSGSLLEKIHIGDVAVTLIAFVILMFLLKKFAFGPLMKVMRDREEQVANDIDSAEKSRQETALLLEEQKEILKQARQEALEMIEQSRKQGDAKRGEILEIAKQEVEKLKISASLEIEQQKTQAIQSLREQAANLSVLIASKVIEKELNAADQQQLIKDFLDKAGE